MPPKKKPEASKKTDMKKKEKVIEDKTFGLKNKKGSKQQKFIQQVTNQVKFGNNPKKTDPLQGTKKEDKKKELDELNQLFRPVASQKVAHGVDPKSVLCAFFKSGQCGKGDKCKFSHDLTIERKSEKKSLYVDARENEDSMENWSEEKLMEVIEKKHGEREKKLPPTDIICKHFLEAVELSKYGWFWECPNGEKCHYRHALPPGFALKKDKKKDKKEDITIEELVEIERSKLGYNLTKITLETFIAWKKKKISEKQAKEKKESERKKAEFKQGKNLGLSGREMFDFNPELARDTDWDEGEAAVDIIREDEDSDDVKEIDLDMIANEAVEADESGTQCADMKRNFNTTTDEADKSDANADEAGTSTANQNGDAEEEDLIDEPIDETLFAEDDDLDGLEDELNAATLK